jgi:2-oxoglutarate dehydrogenase E1 component
MPIIDDEEINHKDVKRLVLCSGKVYVDLMTSDLRQSQQNVAIARVEQLYPFPKAAIQTLLDSYPNLHDVCWLQEEPRNMGAWRFLQPRISDILPLKKGSKTKTVPLHYIGRRRYASPAEGSMSYHKINQDRIVASAFDLEYIDEELAEKRMK